MLTKGWICKNLQSISKFKKWALKENMNVIKFTQYFDGLEIMIQTSDL